jgi:hypothetical protein
MQLRVAGRRLDEFFDELPARVSITSGLWETKLMKASAKSPQHLEDRKAQKLMDRIEEKQILRDEEIRKSSLKPSSPK